MLLQLQIKNLRLIESAELSFQPGLNLVCGENGSGKTTLLEAVYLLAYGRSFRHRESGPLARDGSRSFQLVTRFEDGNQHPHVLGMQRSGEELTLRLDGASVRRRSEILTHLPVYWIGPDPQSLLTEGPERRRAFLYRGMFHVEHCYLPVLQNYQKALDQRNADLRSGARTLQVWDEQLQQNAEMLDGYRASYIESLREKVLPLWEAWKLGLNIDISYQRGWKDKVSLQQALGTNLETDRQRKFTSVGPHRADLVFRSASQRSGKRLSRGQLKMLACALHFAQAMIVQERGLPGGMLLFDDLPAELDRANREKLLESITPLYRQSLIAALAPEDVPGSSSISEMFHVEHGVFSRAQA